MVLLVSYGAASLLTHSSTMAASEPEKKYEGYLDVDEIIYEAHQMQTMFTYLSLKPLIR